MANIVDQTNLVDKSINLLQDVDTSTTAPVAGDLIKFNGSDWFTNQETSLVTTNRESITTESYDMVLGDDVRQYLDPNGAGRYVTLPDPAIAGMYYIIKNLDGSRVLTVRETTTGPNILTLSNATGILESYFIYDGTEWHAQGGGDIIIPVVYDAVFSIVDEQTVVGPVLPPIAYVFSDINEQTVVGPVIPEIAYYFSEINETTVVAP